MTVIWKSIHTIQFKLGVYTYWVSVHNCFTFGSHWPNFGPLVAKKLMKLGENGCFWPPPAKLSTQPNWFLVCTFMWWVFRNYSIFLPQRPYLVPLVVLDVLPFYLIRPQAGTCILWCPVCICSNQLQFQGRQFCSKWFRHDMTIWVVQVSLILPECFCWQQI